ncbi:hypothetical protein ACFUN7_27700 [Streptomyces sp. NPDC057236]|uniref:hypothetical protein n=1 Tax=Streptomyces sp. NPDC057236 TaxID=3346059 RepID=UPI003637AF97
MSVGLVSAARQDEYTRDGVGSGFVAALRSPLKWSRISSLQSSVPVRVRVKANAPASPSSSALANCLSTSAMYSAHSALTGLSRFSDCGSGAGEAFSAAVAATPAAHSTAHAATDVRRLIRKGLGIQA